MVDEQINQQGDQVIISQRVQESSTAVSNKRSVLIWIIGGVAFVVVIFIIWMLFSVLGGGIPQPPAFPE